MSRHCQNPRCQVELPPNSDPRRNYCSLRCKAQAAYHRRAIRERQNESAAPTILHSQAELEATANRLLTSAQNALSESQKQTEAETQNLSPLPPLEVFNELARTGGTKPYTSEDFMSDFMNDFKEPKGK